MLLGQLLKSVKKKYKRINIKGISFDSRRVKKKIFFLRLMAVTILEESLLVKQF